MWYTYSMIRNRTYCCLDCGNKISENSALYGCGRCKSCARKTHKKVYCCQDCGNLISNFTALRGNGRCFQCYNKSKRGKKLNRNFTGKNNPNYKHGKLLKNYFCKCGNLVSLHNGVYGSRTCMSCRTKDTWNCGKFKNRNFKGENNPNYKGGLSNLPYPSSFNDKLKLKIRERDNFTCQCCRLKEKYNFRNLDIHHIDYNKENCKETNLITLCQICNVKANSERDYWFAYYNYIIKEYIYGQC